MTFINITQSSYIFRQQIIIGLITCLVSVALTALAFYRFKKNLKTKENRNREIGQLVFILVIVWTVYLTCFLQILTKTFRLKNYGIETIGKTKQWIYTDDSRRMEYTFEINGVTVIGKSEIVYSGKEIEGIKCPNEKYIVIFDYDDPTNSVMDFKRPAK